MGCGDASFDGCVVFVICTAVGHSRYSCLMLFYCDGDKTGLRVFVASGWWKSYEMSRLLKVSKFAKGYQIVKTMCAARRLTVHCNTM